MTDSEYILEARGLHKSFGTGPGRVEVLRGLDLTVGRGEFVAVMGPSGCGKSTLLHVLGLMSTPDAGGVYVDGREVSSLGQAGRAEVRRRRIGFIFQRFNLLSVLSGRDNILLSRRIRGLGRDGGVEELLAAMGVAQVARRKPAKLSIGEQQRIAVARALAGGGDLILADEPTGSLDSENTAALLELLDRANRRRGRSIVMITHSAEVAAAAGRILHMRDGTILHETR